jgi:hypothetical protein
MIVRKLVPGNHSFVIRIWREGSGWRGWMQHVRSGETGCVRDTEGLLKFIERWTKLADGEQKGLK